MASKVNTKFIAILVVAVIAAAGIIGGLYYLNLRKNAGRNIRIGDEALAAGDVRKAMDYYGRAVYKEPSNFEYLHKYADVLYKVIPENRVEANELYQARLRVLGHEARYDPTNADAHLRLIEEIFIGARTVNQKEWWEMLAINANDMWEQLAENDPKRPLAKTYAAIAAFRLSVFRKPEDLQQAVHDIQENLKLYPKDDLTWATFVAGQMTIAEKERSTGRKGAAMEELYRLVDADLAKAMEAVPDGVEVARMNLIRLLMLSTGDKPNAIQDQIDHAADHLQALLKSDAAGQGILTEGADILGQVRGTGLDRAADILVHHLQNNPGALDKRLGLAKLYYYKSEPDLAEENADKVINAPQLPVSFLSQLQGELRRQAASVLIDVKNRRWELAPADQRAAALKAVEAARAKLIEFVDDPGNDPLVLRADGKIAFDKGEYNKAATCFERLVKDAGGADAELLMYSAICLERVGQFGLAADRAMLALDRIAGTPPDVWLISRVRILAEAGRFDEASKAFDALPDSAKNDEQAKRLSIAIQNRSSGSASVSSDPMVAAVTKANAAVAKGDVDGARKQLLAALETATDKAGILQALAGVEMRAGQPEKAKQYIADALKLRPDDTTLLRFQAMLNHDDPLDAMHEYQKNAFTDDKERMIAALVNLTAMAPQQEAYAARMESAGKADLAAKARDVAARAMVEAQAVAALIEQSDPANPQLLEYRFNKAIIAKDWPLVEQTLTKIKAANVDQAEGMFFQGRYELARGNYQDAVHSLNVATDRIGFNALAWRGLGAAYLNLGNFAQAERAFEQAYKINPADIDAIKAYLSVLMRRGDQTRALGILRKARQVAPGDIGIRDLWLQHEADAGDPALAFRERRTIFMENPDDHSNAVFYAKLLGEVQPTRELIVDDKGNQVFNEQRWGALSVADQERAIVKSKEEWNTLSDAILDAMLKDKLDPQLVSLRANLLRRRGDVASGESLLREYVAKNKDEKLATPLLIELGRYQAQSSHFVEAISTLEEAAAHQDPKKREADVELGGLYLQLGQNERALARFQAIQAAVPDAPVKKQLVESLAHLRRFDEADKTLRELIASGVDDDVTAMLAAGIAEGRGDDLIAKGDTAGAVRRFAEQREALAKAEAKQPGSPTPRVLLAQSLLKEYRRTHAPGLLDDALAALDRAESIRAGSPEISMLRTQVLRDKAESNPNVISLRRRLDQDIKDDSARRELAQIYSPVINELRRLLDRFPDSVTARRDLMQAYIDVRDADGAIAVIDQGIKVNPTLAELYEARGDLLKLARRDAASAAASYAKADDVSPTVTRLIKYLDAEFNSAKPNCQAAADRLAARTEDLKTAPGLREFYARTFICLSKRDQALDQLSQAYAMRKQLVAAGKSKPEDIGAWFMAVNYVFAGTPETPGLNAAAAEKFFMGLCGEKPDVYEIRSLSETWLLSGNEGFSRAVELMRQAIAGCPADDTAFFCAMQMQLANYLILAGDHAAAAVAYEEVLKRQPDNIGALNNIAFLYADDLEKPDLAMPHADKVLKLAPADASILDTVGWVNYRAGKLEVAKTFLQDSLKLQRTPATMVHLVEVLYVSGDAAGAKSLLDEASKLNLDHTTRQKMERLKDDISNNRTPGSSPSK